MDFDFGNTIECAIVSGCKYGKRILREFKAQKKSMNDLARAKRGNTDCNEADEAWGDARLWGDSTYA